MIYLVYLCNKIQICVFCVRHIQIRICSVNLNSKYLVHRSKRIFLFLQKFSRIIYILFFNI